MLNLAGVIQSISIITEWHMLRSVVHMHFKRMCALKRFENQIRKTLVIPVIRLLFYFRGESFDLCFAMRNIGNTINNDDVISTAYDDKQYL